MPKGCAATGWAALHWLGAAFIQEGGLYLGLMPFAIVGLAAILSLFWALATSLAHLCWSSGALPATLATMRRQHPAWRLLRAANAILVLSFLGRVFVEGNP